MSPFLKTILEEICPCNSVSLILPDVPPESLSSFTDWLLAGCIGEISSEWNEIFALLGLKISRDPVGKGREELLLKQFKHLDLRSSRNSSDTDMFLTDLQPCPPLHAGTAVLSEAPVNIVSQVGII